MPLSTTAYGSFHVTMLQNTNQSTTILLTDLSSKHSFSTQGDLKLCNYLLPQNLKPYDLLGQQYCWEHIQNADDTSCSKEVKYKSP